jgi:hypothetical protein
MTPTTRPHSYIPGAAATTGTSVDELIRPGLHLAYAVPSADDVSEAKFRHLLEALAKHRAQRDRDSEQDPRSG